jgi:hypothetical protein
MMQQNTFDKIKDFVKDHISSDVVLIRPRDDGFKVNDYKIAQKDGFWTICDNRGYLITQMFSRKYAVLSAILLTKKRSNDFRQLQQLDKQMAVASEDQVVFEKRLQECRDAIGESIYIARLSRAKQSLEIIRQQIRELEKSLQLQ